MPPTVDEIIDSYHRYVECQGLPKPQPEDGPALLTFDNIGLLVAEIERLRPDFTGEPDQNPLEKIRAKCEQYWNEHGIGDAEIHVVLERINTWAHDAHREIERLREDKERIDWFERIRPDVSMDFKGIWEVSIGQGTMYVRQYDGGSLREALDAAHAQEEANDL